MNALARLTLLCIAVSAGLCAQMSPGQLSKAHQDLEGPLECAKCHVFGSRTPQLVCLDCHKEIARRLAAKRGYHALQVKGQGSNDCGRCHSEHNGLKYPIVKWPVKKENFDHNQAGWKLEGKHALLKCAQCHNSKYISTADYPLLKRRDPNSSFAALDTACIACHKDIHASQLSKNCTECHSQDTWKNPPGFSHQKSNYPLTGLHSNVACAGCHKAAPGGGPVQYKNYVFFQSCAACHKDPHAGSLGKDCSKCHVTGGWKNILPANGFDHSKTKYPLLGKHAAVACLNCHKTDNFTTPVPFGRCLDCHKDEHHGEFAKRANGGDCKPCHNESAWKPALFAVEDHMKSAYPLLGKHAEAGCAKCHEPKGKETRYHTPFASCTDCHKDPHKGQFAAKPHLNRCQDCHDEKAWKPANYTIPAHNKTNFALKGAHAAVPCSGCHTGSGADIQYHPPAGQCVDCHKDPHGPLTSKAGCEQCHSVAVWKERGRFDHSKTEFALGGRHAAVDCLACHKPVDKTIPFRGAPKDCEGCHADVHGGQFQTTGLAGKGCARCHTDLTWRPTEFDHTNHSTFALDGAHIRVPCQMCHNERREVNGRSLIVYKGTPRECKACHP